LVYQRRVRARRGRAMNQGPLAGDATPAKVHTGDDGYSGWPQPQRPFHWRGRSLPQRLRRGSACLRVHALRHGAPTGEHGVTFRPEGDRLTVETRVDIAVKGLFITAFRSNTKPEKCGSRTAGVRQEHSGCQCVLLTGCLTLLEFADVDAHGGGAPRWDFGAC